MVAVTANPHVSFSHLRNNNKIENTLESHSIYHNKFLWRNSACPTILLSCPFCHASLLPASLIMNLQVKTGVKILWRTDTLLMGHVKKVTRWNIDTSSQFLQSHSFIFWLFHPPPPPRKILGLPMSQCPLLSLYNQYVSPGPAVSPSQCEALPSQCSHWPLSVAIPL